MNNNNNSIKNNNHKIMNTYFKRRVSKADELK